MQRFHGKPLAPGYAKGQAFIYKEPLSPPRTVRRSIDAPRVRSEVQRFEKALQASLRELEGLKERVLTELGESESRIFEAHLALLKDMQFIEKIRARIAKERVNVEHAVQIEIEELEKLLLQLENEYIRERAQDVRDVGNRVLKHLHRPRAGSPAQLKQVPPATILVCHELLPSDTLQLDRERIVAIVTEQGGAQSHAAILARALGIPSVTGIQGITNKISSGDWLLVDGQDGTVTLFPSKRATTRFVGMKRAYDNEQLQQIRGEFRHCMTLDGTAVDLYANIGRIEDAQMVQAHYLSGVGLFRTEYLFMESSRTPSLSKQVAAYTEVAKLLNGLPFVIRTLDLGGDKYPSFIRREDEDNPAMGVRGLRYMLRHGNLFETQLRAILRASRYGDVRIMFPMVIGVEDLRDAMEMMHRAAEHEGISQLPRIGALIETPAAVFEINDILDMVDFVSIGTNDLTQFILAADRGSLAMLDNNSVLHPSVLKAIVGVVNAAHAKGREVCVCGEAAGDPGIACLLVGLGVRQLSMSPVRAARVRHHIRRSHLRDFEQAANEALGSKDIKKVETIVSRLLINQEET